MGLQRDQWLNNKAVRDKINPIDTWIQRRLGLMSRTLLPPSEEKIVQVSGHLGGIETSRRYDDVSVLTVQAMVYKTSRDLLVWTERAYLGYLCLGITAPRGWQQVGVVSSRLDLSQPGYGAATSQDLLFWTNISRISSPRRLAGNTLQNSQNMIRIKFQEIRDTTATPWLMG